MPEERPRPSPARGGKSSILKSKSRWSARLRTVGLVLAVLAVFGGPERATGSADKSSAIRLAQRAEPQISIALTIMAQPASQVSLPIQVGPSRALPKTSFVRLRGLPHFVSLTEGYSVGPGSWEVPLYGLPTLKANVPAGASGRSELVISLVSIDGTLLAEARTVLVVETAAMMPRVETPPLEPQNRSSSVPSPASPPNRKSQASPRPAELSAEVRERAEQLVAQGERYLAQGKVGGARLFFRQAADAGFALAAIRLAATFDPAELSRLQVQGIAPDAAEARRWYERARELGAPEAEERLARLGDK
jgi:hypothetical protein